MNKKCSPFLRADIADWRISFWVDYSDGKVITWLTDISTPFLHLFYGNWKSATGCIVFDLGGPLFVLQNNLLIAHRQSYYFFWSVIQMVEYLLNLARRKIPQIVDSKKKSTTATNIYQQNDNAPHNDIIPNGSLKAPISTLCLRRYNSFQK